MNLFGGLTYYFQSRELLFHVPLTEHSILKNNLRRSVVACDRPPFLYPYASAQAKHWSPANKPITNITPIRK